LIHLRVIARERSDRGDLPFRIKAIQLQLQAEAGHVNPVSLLQLITSRSPRFARDDVLIQYGANHDNIINLLQSFLDSDRDVVPAMTYCFQINNKALFFVILNPLILEPPVKCILSQIFAQC